jgi:tRNA(fMet)-specific endonuclease VapC
MRLQATPIVDVGISIITKAELFYGSAKSQTPERSRQKQFEFLQRIQTVLFDETAALIYGDIRALLERQGTPIGANDLLIAASA